MYVSSGHGSEKKQKAHSEMGHTLTVLTTHSVVTLVSSAAFTMTSLRQTRIDKTLTAPHMKALTWQIVRGKVNHIGARRKGKRVTIYTDSAYEVGASKVDQFFL